MLSDGRRYPPGMDSLAAVIAAAWVAVFVVAAGSMILRPVLRAVVRSLRSVVARWQAWRADRLDGLGAARLPRLDASGAAARRRGWDYSGSSGVVVGRSVRLDAASGLARRRRSLRSG